MENFFKWLINSSENPKEVSMTIRGIALSYLPLLATFFNEVGIVNIEADLVAYVVIVTAVLGSLLTIVGLVRKIYNTYSGNEVVTFVAKKKKK